MNVFVRLCSRDPHQLFQRLESQVREFVIEKKVNLRKKINAGYSTPPQAREIMSMLLEEYTNLSDVARIVSENLSTLVSCLCDQFGSCPLFVSTHLVFLGICCMKRYSF